MTDRSDSREIDRGDREIGGEEDDEAGEGTDAETEGDADGSDHLDDLEDGAGCTEIWEHLSERRETERNEAE